MIIKIIINLFNQTCNRKDRNFLKSIKQKVTNKEAKINKV